MKLEELLEMGFSRGCGISVDEAFAMPRFGELLDRCGDHPYPAQAALVQLLGEQLIEAAFGCLPDAVQLFAKTWPEMSAEEQLDTLRPMCDSLASDMWYWHHGRERPAEHKQTSADVLPLEFGPWETGAVCPSCMGMGTLLTAFAKRTGAPHWLAHVNKSIMYEIQGMDLEVSHGVMSFLRQHLPMAAKSGAFELHNERLELVLGAIVNLNKYNFHPSMVIQLKDDRWVLVDPYFGTLAVLEEPDWPISEANDLMLNSDVAESTVLMGSRKPILEYRDRLFRESGFLGGLVVSILESVVEDGVCDASSLAGAVSVLRALVEMQDSLSWMNPLLEGIGDDQLMAQGLFKAGEKITPAKTTKAIARLDRDPQFARLAVERMLAFVFTLWIQRVIDDLEKMSRTVPHSSLELSHPATGIAVGTLNNLRVYDGSRPRSAGGVLVLFHRAQSIWHDAMHDVRGRKRVPRLIAETLERLEDVLASEPPEFLHPHVARMIAARREEGGAAWQPN